MAIDRERAARRDAIGVRRAHDERAAAAHFRMENAHRIVLRIVRAEGIGADELGEAARHMRLGAAHRAHFVKDHRHAGARELPRGLAAGKTAADDVHRMVRTHGRTIDRARAPGNWRGD